MHAHERATSTLRDLLIKNRWNQGERLPSLAELARLCGVSRNTMWKSLRALKKEDRVHTSTRGAIIAGPQGIPTLPTSPQSGFVWQRLKERIGREVVDGTIAGPRLELVSKLAVEYDVSPITLRKALASLADEGLLTYRDHHYLVRRPSPYHLSTIVFISAGNVTEGINTTDERTVSLIDAFERESSKGSIALRLVAFNAAVPGDRLSVLRAVKKVPELAGFVVNLWAFWDPSARPRWMDLIRALALLDKPVVIADQVGDLVLPSEISDLTNVRVLRISGIRAGEIVGDFALRHVHRTIAYVSPDFTATWARNRQTGLAGFIKRYGGAETRMEVFGHAEPMSDLSGLVIELLDLDKSEVQSLFSERYNARGVLMALQPAVGSLGGLPLTAAHHETLATLRAAGRHLALLAHDHAKTDTYNLLFEAFYTRASTLANTLYLDSLFDRVLHESRATLWVSSSDKTGDAALLYLRAKNVSVPEKISILGFDNLRWSKGMGLSSYDFNMAAMAAQARRLIQDEKSLKSQPPVAEVDGYVVERKTTLRRFDSAQRPLRSMQALRSFDPSAGLRNRRLGGPLRSLRQGPVQAVRARR